MGIYYRITTILSCNHHTKETLFVGIDLFRGVMFILLLFLLHTVCD